MKNILLINGSPREDGNTKILSEAFVTRSIQKRNIVKKYNIPDLNISGCKDCGKCFIDGIPCIIKDDFDEIIDEIIKADVIVFSAPVFFYSVPGQLKNFIDRLNCFIVGNKNLSGKKYAIISSCDKEDMSVFDGFRIPIERMAKDFGWILIDEVLAPNVKDAKDIEQTDGVRRARELADRII